MLRLEGTWREFLLFPTKCFVQVDKKTVWRVYQMVSKPHAWDVRGDTNSRVFDNWPRYLPSLDDFKNHYHTRFLVWLVTVFSVFLDLSTYFLHLANKIGNLWKLSSRVLRKKQRLQLLWPQLQLISVVRITAMNMQSVTITIKAIHASAMKDTLVMENRAWKETALMIENVLKTSSVWHPPAFNVSALLVSKEIWTRNVWTSTNVWQKLTIARSDIFVWIILVALLVNRRLPKPPTFVRSMTVISMPIATTVNTATAAPAKKDTTVLANRV